MKDIPKQFSRRDFLKLSAVGIAVAAGTRVVKEASAQGIPTSIVETSEKNIESFKKIASQKNIPPEAISAFTVRLGFAEWDFFTIAPTETTDSNGQIIETGERLFFRDIVFNPRGGVEMFSSRYVELAVDPDPYRQVAADGVTQIVTWSMVKREPRPDKDQNDVVYQPILWFPIRSEEEWIEASQNNNVDDLEYLGFAPPESVGALTNWGLERDPYIAYPIALNQDLPEKARNSLIKRERIKINHVPFDQMSPEQKLALAPENEHGYKPDHTFKSSFVVYKDSDGKVQQLYDLATKEWKLPKEAEYVTAEEWHDEIFGGKFIGDDGKEYPYQYLYEDATKKIISNPEDVMVLPENSAITILNPTGEVMIWGKNNETVVELVKKGGIVLVSNSVLPDLETRIILLALNSQYKSGRTNLSLTFNKSIGYPPRFIMFNIKTDDKYFLIEKTIDGRFISPIINAPKSDYSLFISNEDVTNEHQSLENLASDKYWIDDIIKAGYDGIRIKQSSN